MSDTSPITPGAVDQLQSSQGYEHYGHANPALVTPQHTAGSANLNPADDFASLKDEERWTSASFNAQLLQATSKLPLTSAARDILEYVKSSHRCDPMVLAHKIGHDDRLSALLLRISNTRVYNRSGQPLSNMTDAMVQVGVKRMSELAVGASFLTLAQPPRVMGFEAPLAWRRGLAAVLAADQILQRHKSCDESHSVMLCALLAPWGRMFTATACPDVYAAMLVESHRSQRPLIALEQELFPRSPSSAMAHVLATGGIASDACGPLEQADLTFGHLERLDPSVQTRVQILKAAVLLGEFAVGQWMPWDEISFPTNMQLREIGAGAPREIVDLVRTQLQEEAHLARLVPGTPHSSQPEAAEPHLEVPYCNLALEIGDLMPCLLESMGFQVRPSTTDDPQGKNGMLINCLHTPISWLAAKARNTPHSGWVMVTTEDYPPSWNWLGTFLQTPASYQAIRNTCNRIAPRKHRGEETPSIVAADASIDRAPPAPQTSPSRQPSAKSQPPSTSQPVQQSATYEPLNADA